MRIQVLYAAVAANNWTLLEKLFRGPTLSALALEEYRNLIRNSIKYTRPKCLRAILTNAPKLKDQFLKQESELVKTEDGHSVLGETCLEYFNKGILEVLAEVGCKYISQQELKLFITQALFSETESENGFKAAEKISKLREHSSCSQSSNENTDTEDAPTCIHVLCLKLNEIKQTKASTQLACFVVLFPNIHADVLKLVEHLPMKDLLPSYCWWYHYLRYGWLFRNVAFRALIQLEHSRFELAKETILLIKTDNMLNTHFKVYFPPSEAGSSCSLLSNAISLCKNDIVKLLIKQGANVNEFCGQNKNGNIIFFTPLELAVERNFTDICQVLVENGSNLNMSSSGYYGKMLKNTLVNGNVEILALLLGSHRYPYSELLLYSNNLDQMQEDSEVRQAMKSFLDHCLQYGIRNKTTLAFDALDKQDWPAVEKLVLTMSKSELNEIIVLVNQQDGSVVKKTVLLHAVMNNHNTFVKCLVAKGAMVDCVCELGSEPPQTQYTSALCQAFQTGNVDLIRFLLKTGAQMVFQQSGNSVLAVISVYLSRDPKMFQLCMDHTYFKRRHIFAYFMMHCTHEDTIEWFPVSNIFTIDVLKVLFSEELYLTKGIWRLLIRKTLLSSGKQKSAYLSILGVLMNYLPAMTVSLREIVVAYFALWPTITNVPVEVTEESAEYLHVLYRESRSVHSLQHLCRYAVRRHCTPFSRKEISAFEIPVHMEDYLLQQIDHEYLKLKQRIAC